MLFTTVPFQRLAASQCIELYRLRWQIELLFKRWKSLCGFDRMPNHRPDTILSWLYAKILAALLLERLASQQSEVSPPIPRGRRQERHRAPAMEVDPTVLAPLRRRAIADHTLSRAHQHQAHH